MTKKEELLAFIQQNGPALKIIFMPTSKVLAFKYEFAIGQADLESIINQFSDDLSGFIPDYPEEIKILKWAVC